MAAFAAIVLTLAGCSGKANVYAKTTPYVIDSADKVSITFESKGASQADYGAFFVSAAGIPAPEAKATYNPVEIPANAGKTIIVRAYYRDRAIANVNKVWNIDKEVDFELPALKAGSYTISYLYNQIGGGNKRLALKDSSGNILKEIKVD